jgi:hypothetical protein
MGCTPKESGFDFIEMRHVQVCSEAHPWVNYMVIKRPGHGADARSYISTPSLVFMAWSVAMETREYTE